MRMNKLWTAISAALMLSGCGSEEIKQSKFDLEHPRQKQQENSAERRMCGRSKKSWRESVRRLASATSRHNRLRPAKAQKLSEFKRAIRNRGRFRILIY